MSQLSIRTLRPSLALHDCALEASMGGICAIGLIILAASGLPARDVHE